MIALSVNVNKVALLRNSRGAGQPDPLWAARKSLEAGCQGITVHPRSDGRHIQAQDVRNIKALLSHWPQAEFNVEGRPSPDFLSLMEEIRPHQCTLVPDAEDALTSDSGWRLESSSAELGAAMRRLANLGIRPSVFMDPGQGPWAKLRDMGAQRVEIYTGPYAKNPGTVELGRIHTSLEGLASAGLQANAGHDLTVENLPAIVALGGIREVSIGHHLVIRALEKGWTPAVRDFLDVLSKGG